MTTSFGRYELLRKIATGGMAEIFLAKQRGTAGFEKPVVVKRILPELTAEAEAVRMFLNEARLSATLNHPNIVQVFDFGCIAGRYFLTMEYIPGKDLDAIGRHCRASGTRVPLEHLLAIATRACQGLHHAHTQRDAQGRSLGIVHRDVSPQNILVSFDGAVKLLDFGIARARAADRKLTRHGMVKGKVGYMSPEQCRGDPLDGRSDLFALGIVLWELLTGTDLFESESDFAWMTAIQQRPAPAPRTVRPELPPEIDQLIGRALERDPARRFQSGLEMGLALQTLADSANLRSGDLPLAFFLRELFPADALAARGVSEIVSSGVILEPAALSGLGFEDTNPRAMPAPVPMAATPREGPPRLATPAALPAAPAKPARPRRRKIWLAAGLLLAACAIGSGVWLALQKGWIGSGQTPTLIVESDPAEAAVEVDGVYRCFTPCALTDLAPGRTVQLRLTKAGFLPHRARLRIPQAQPGRVSAILKPR